MSYGRRVIYADVAEITPENVQEEVRKAMLVHSINRREIRVLDEYRRGKTAILRKKKEVRENINHKISEPHAGAIVAFHKGYVFGEPIQYVRRETADGDSRQDDEIARDINRLNGYMSDADKRACDDALADWLYTAGTSYRLTLPNKAWTKDGDEPPFKVFSLDPANTCVVYSNGIEHEPLMGICCVRRGENRREVVYSGYTDKFYFEFSDISPLVVKPHKLGMIPIIEYPAEVRCGIFERAVSIIDAIDELQSNRMDDVVQYVNSFLAILGGQLDEETYKKLNEWKTLCLPDGVDAKYLSPAMSQEDIQTLKDDLYMALLTTCGVPNRNGGSSTSDTGAAVVYRDGFYIANVLASTTESNFKCSEKPFLKLVLRILRDTVGTCLKLTDIEPHFTRRNYENLASKSQVLISMLNNPKIHPELAFQSSGMFVDPESAYLQSMAWQKMEETKNEIQDNDPKAAGEGTGEAGAEGAEGEKKGG